MMVMLTDQHTCSICSCSYSDDEGGIQGYIGMLPASFCPTCLSGVIDMVQQLTADDELVNIND